MSAAPEAQASSVPCRSPFELFWSLLYLAWAPLHRVTEIATIREAPASALTLREHVGADRSALEAFIRDRFAESFGARVEAFMPRLFGLHDANDALCGALGLRSAQCRLFVEHYLDRPIEHALAAHAGRAVERSTIVEVGHFSGVVPGTMRSMIRLLTARLHDEGFEWVVFTGTSALRNAFARLGLRPIRVHTAEIESLPEDARNAWGSYYDCAPWVLAGRIDDGYRALHCEALAEHRA